jgi:ATP-dependent protease ClpP protease subunit
MKFKGINAKHIFDATDNKAVGHIYVYGDIYHAQQADANEWGIVSMKTVLDQIQSQPDAKEFIVHIHSRGGDVNEGFAIHDALVSSGKKITTHVEGLCASIATVIALAGSERKMNKNSDFFIHNPWGDPFMMNGFTADDYEKRAEQIRQAETKLLDFYVAKTGADAGQLSAMMKEETTLTADQALEMKFITEVVDTINAVAKLGKTQTQNKEDMTKVARAISFLDGLKAFLNGESQTSPTLALKMTLKDGTEIEVETEGNDIAVDDVVTINGEPAPDGEHELSDGRKITTAGGKVTEIKPAETTEEGSESNEETEALQAQINQLTEENNTLRTQNQELQNNMNTIMDKVKSLEALAKKTGSTFTPENRDFNRQKGGADESVEARIARRKAEAAQNKPK